MSSSSVFASAGTTSSAPAVTPFGSVAASPFGAPASTSVFGGASATSNGSSAAPAVGSSSFFSGGAFSATAFAPKAALTAADLESHEDSPDDYSEVDNGSHHGSEEEGGGDEDREGDDAHEDDDVPPPQVDAPARPPRHQKLPISVFRAFAASAGASPAPQAPLQPLGSTFPTTAPAPPSVFGGGSEASAAPAFPFNNSAEGGKSSVFNSSLSSSVLPPPAPVSVFKSALSMSPPVPMPPADPVFEPLASRGGRGLDRHGGRGNGRGGRGGSLPSMSDSSRPDRTSGSSNVAKPHHTSIIASPVLLGHSALDNEPVVKLFDVFLQRLHLSDAAERELSSFSVLEAAFFNLKWNVNTPAECLNRMIQKCTQSKPAALQRVKLERWAVVFFLGCNINMILRCLKSGEAADSGEGAPRWQDVLRTVLTRANALADTYQELFNESRQEGGPDSLERRFVPYLTIRAVLCRVRGAFEAAASVGFYDVASSESQLLGAIVRRETAAVLFKPLTAPPTSNYQHLIAQTQASIMCEFAALKSVTEITKQFEFSESFHTYCPDDVELRCSLYYRNAQLIIQTQTLTGPNLHKARDLLAHALALSPRDHPNTRVVARWFAAASFSLGFIPSREDAGRNGDGAVNTAWFEAYGLQDEFTDIAVALATANSALYEESMTRRLAHFTECGVASMMQYARVHVRTAIVLNYFRVMGRSNRLSLEGLIEYVGPLPKPYQHVMDSAEMFSRLWLMPLLLEKLINGTVVGSTLLLSKARPFELHDVEAV